MNILVGNTTLAVNSCYVFRYESGKIVLRMVVPQTEIAHDNLKTLLKNNTDDIIKTNDDGTKETLSGLNCNEVSITDKDDIYSVEINLKSEAEYQISLLKAEVVALKTENAALEETIAAQEEEIATLNDTLLEVLMTE